MILQLFLYNFTYVKFTHTHTHTHIHSSTYLLAKLFYPFLS